MAFKEKEQIQPSRATYYHKLFQDAFDFHKERFLEYTELVAYYELQQDNLNSLVTKPWIYQINTPFATDAINLRVASLQANDYTGELEPLSPSDEDAVYQLNSVYHAFWNDMNMDNAINDAILISSVVGEAYTHIIYDDTAVYGGTDRKNKGKLKGYFIDAASVHLDPKALSIKDADYICISERVTRNKIKEQYPEYTFEGIKGDDSDEERGEIYAGANTTAYSSDPLMMNSAGTRGSRASDAKVYNKVTIYEKVDGVVEKTVLLEKTILAKTKKMEIRQFPIAQMKWQKRLKSPYGTSLMQMLLPLQKVLNEIESANANANMQYSSPSYVLSEDSGIDPEELALNAGAPAAVYVTASGYPIKDLIQPLIPDRGIDQGLVTTKQELERSIYKLAGITDGFLGDFGTAGNTSGGADMAQQRSKTIEQRVLTNIEEFVEDLTRIIVEYIVQGYAGDKVYARGEKQSNGKFLFKEFNIPENAADMEYSFYIELNVKTQYSKDQQRIAMKELFEVERQYDTGDVKVLNILDILKSLNIPQTEELVERYTNLAKMDASQRAQIVTEIITTGQQFGVDAQIVNEAVTEIMLNKQETPAVEMFMQTVEQIKMQQQQAQQNVQAGLMKAELEKQQLAAQPTGDEVYDG